MRSILLYLLLCTGVVACSPSSRIANAPSALPVDTAAAINTAQQVLLKDTALAGAHLGISIYDPTASRYLYNYQGDKYFVPASNTKLFTCYAAMRYLGDSLVGLRYDTGSFSLQDGTVSSNYVNIQGAGDPTFLHPDFKNQPVLTFLNHFQTVAVPLTEDLFYTKPLGKGWPWDDYMDNYQVERSALPMYGNVVRYSLQSDTIIANPPTFFNAWFQSRNNNLRKQILPWFTVTRDIEDNNFIPVSSNEMYRSKTKFSSQVIPFKTITRGKNQFDLSVRTYVQLLEDTLHKKLEDWDYIHKRLPLKNIIHSQPTDSLLKPMMHRSDNFFAEQSLLMVSNEKLGYMSDEAIIDTLLKTDLKDLPQKPVWVDGSGLSRYNLFTPQDMVAVLLKMKNEFGLERIRNILPKGNTGTLTNYYQQIGPAIFAKTGSLSGQVALSGFLTAKTGKLLVFSLIINNYNSSGRAVRRAMEKFILQVWEKN